MDSINGAGSHALPTMLQSLGCEVIELNCNQMENLTGYRTSP